MFLPFVARRKHRKPCHSLLGMMSAFFDENLKIKCTVVNQTIQIHMQINEMGWNSIQKCLCVIKRGWKIPQRNGALMRMSSINDGFSSQKFYPFVACAGFLSSI